MITAISTVITDAPIDIGRDEAQELARHELAHQVYRDAEPSLWERASSWAWEHFTELLTKAGGALGGIGWVLLLALVVLTLVVVVAWRTGSIERRRRGSSTPLFERATRSAADHTRAAEAAAARSEWSVAVVEAFRSLIRDLEERGQLDERPGRTADEAARDAGLAFPPEAEALLEAARAFDEVAYGDRPGTADAYAQVKACHGRLRSTRAAAVR